MKKSIVLGHFQWIPSLIGIAMTMVMQICPSAWADSYGWNTSYGGGSDYYPSSSYSNYGSGRGYGRSGGPAEVISIDMDPQSLLNSSFRVASRERRLNDVERLLKEGAEIDSRSEAGTTALMYASRNCAINLVSFLVLHGANINAADSEGKTPLILAARESCVKVVALLLKYPKIDLDARDQTKKSAKDYAGENAILEVGGTSQKIMGLIEATKRRVQAAKKRTQFQSKSNIG